MLVQSVRDNLQFICSQRELFSSAVNALSAVLAERSAVSSALSTNISSAIAVLATGCQDYLAVGERPVALYADNLKMETSVNSASTFAGAALAVPLSDYERYLGRQPVAMSYRSELDPAVVPAIGISLLQLSYSSNSGLTNASIVAIQSVFKGDSGRRRLQSTESSEVPTSGSFTITLQNVVDVHYSSRAVNHTLVRCNRLTPSPYAVAVDCPDGLPHSILCPARLTGYFAAECPGFVTVPECRLWTGEAFEPSPTCSMLDFSASNTTCRCEVPYDPSGRRLAGGDVLVETQISAALTVVATPLAYAFEAYPQIPAVERSIVALSAISLLFALLGCVVLYVALWRKRKVKRSKVLAVAESTATYETAMHNSIRTISNG